MTPSVSATATSRLLLLAGASSRCSPSSSKSPSRSSYSSYWWIGCATSHLLHRLDPEHRQPGGDDERHSPHQRKTRPGQIGIRRYQKPECRVVLALRPQQVELRRDILQKEGDTVRFVDLGGAPDDARPAREQPNQAEFRGISKPVERGIRQRRVAQLGSRKQLRRMPHYRGGAGMRVLHIKDRIV